MHHASGHAKLLPCACTALRRTSRVVTRLYDDSLRPAGVTATQLAVLRALDRLGETPLSELAGILAMDRTTLYRTLRPMTGAGWIGVRDPVSGRAKRAHLTSAGRRVMAAAATAWEAAQTRFVAGFGVSEWRRLYAMLARAATAANAD